MRSSVAAAYLILDLIVLTDATLARLDGRSLDADEDAQDAVAFRLLHIGEAVKSLDEEARGSSSEIAWERAVAMRHRLAHDYLGVDASILWDTAIRQLPPLAAACHAIIAESEQS